MNKVPCHVLQLLSRLFMDIYFSHLSCLFYSPVMIAVCPFMATNLTLS